MTPDHKIPTPSKREYAIVLGPPVLLFIIVGFCAALAWMVFISFWLALRHGDGSAFHPPADSTQERLDWDTRSGSYTWLGESEERLLYDDESLH